LIKRICSDSDKATERLRGLGAGEGIGDGLDVDVGGISDSVGVITGVEVEVEVKLGVMVAVGEEEGAKISGGSVEVDIGGIATVLTSSVSVAYSG